MHGIPTSGNTKRQTCLSTNTCFMASASFTYSASVVKSVTHLCVLVKTRNKHLHASLALPKLISYRLPFMHSLRQQTHASSNLLLYLAEKLSRMSSSVSHIPKYQVLPSSAQTVALCALVFSEFHLHVTLSQTTSGTSQLITLA